VSPQPTIPETAEGACRLGVLALGDSITNGGGELQWGVALQSWALWSARGLGLAYTPYAVDGAIVSQVLEEQIPAFRERTAHPEARYELGCLYVGTNDVRTPGWDAARFGRQFDEALAFLRARCDRLVTPTIPLDMGRPRSPRQVAEANREIRAAAVRQGALVLDLSHFGARNLVMTDHVHPTAFGQIAIAERALALLAADGMTVRVRPCELILYQPTERERLLGDIAYVYRRIKVGLRAHVLPLWLRLLAARERRRG
jgi:lysophospholipase L1-like esterase